MQWSRGEKACRWEAWLVPRTREGWGRWQDQPCRKGVCKPPQTARLQTVRGGRSLGAARQEARAGLQGPPAQAAQPQSSKWKKLVTLVWLRGGGR